jgi:cytochrome c oxidase cbb3-type subunit 4
MDLGSLFRALHSFWVVWIVLTFVAIVGWTLWPSHKQRLESYGRIPLDEDR